MERVLAFRQHQAPAQGASNAAASNGSNNGSLWAQQQPESPAEATAEEQEGSAAAGKGAEWRSHEAQHQGLPAVATDNTLPVESMAGSKPQPTVRSGPASAAAGTATAAASASAAAARASKVKGPPAVHRATVAVTSTPRQQQAAPAGSQPVARSQLGIGGQGGSDETGDLSDRSVLAATAPASRQAAGALASWQTGGAGGGLHGAAGSAAAAGEPGQPADAQPGALGTAVPRSRLPAAGASSSSAAPGLQRQPVAPAEAARGLAPSAAAEAMLASSAAEAWLASPAAEAGQAGFKRRGEASSSSWSADAHAPASRIPGPSRRSDRRDSVPSGSAHSGPAQDANAEGSAAETR